MRNAEFKSVLLVACAICPPMLVTGCAGALKRSVVRYTSNGEFSTALHKLERAGVGIEVSPDASEDQLEARVTYLLAVEKHFVPTIKQSRRDGDARDALKKSDDAAKLCPWSTVLEEARKIDLATVATIDRFTAHAKNLLRSTLAIDALRSELGKAAQLRNNVSDSPDARNAITELESRLQVQWASTFRDGIPTATSEFFAQLSDDLALTDLGMADRTNVVQSARLLHALPWQGSSVAADPVSVEYRERLTALAARLTTSRGPTTTTTLDKALSRTLERWCTESLPPLLQSVGPDFELTDMTESLIDRGFAAQDSNALKALAKAHRSCARQRATQGKAASIALVHLERARALEPEYLEDHAISNIALASYSATPPLTPTVSLEVSTDVDPQVYEWIQMAIRASLEAKTLAHCTWRWVDPAYQKAEVRIRLSSAELFVPSMGDLSVISSRYLSHYENVANPEKERLNNLISLAKIDLSYKEIAYNSAVTSHNIYPTEWSLANANTAYSSYKMALDYHNTLVVLYNATSSTISQPVYLPYNFFEGTIKQGWRVHGDIQVGKETTPFSAESIQRDFVRFGAKYNDVNSRYRRDDRIDIDTSADNLVHQLVSISTQVTDRMSTPLLAISVADQEDLSEQESRLLSWLMHPFGPDSKLAERVGLPKWAVQIGGRVVLPRRHFRPPEQTIERFRRREPRPELTAEVLAAQHGPHVCEVISGSRTLLVQGSGALISSDGLILTCAHVLRGEMVKIRFNTGAQQGEYKGVPVFVNEASDVALVRAEGLRSTTWLNVRLGASPKPGERIVALGNPSLPDGSAVEGAISEGIISSTESSYWGQPRIVADVTVASGSSGGPLVSMETGEVVGVTVAVAKAGMEKDRSASGFFSLAAPSRHLQEWLGLRYTLHRQP